MTRITRFRAANYEGYGLLGDDLITELEDLLDQIGTQGGAGLDAIPRAPPAEVPDDRQRASKR